MQCTTRAEHVAKRTKPNGEEMREIVVLAVADDEHGCGSSGGKGRRTATRRREARRRVSVHAARPTAARAPSGNAEGQRRVLRLRHLSRGTGKTWDACTR